MTHTVTFSTLISEGNKKIRVADLDITSYTAAGEALTAAEFGLKKLSYIRVIDPRSDNGHIWQYDITNAKMTAYKTNAGGVITESFPDAKGGDFATASSDQNATHTNGAFVLALSDAEATTSGNLAHANGVSSGLTNPNTAASEAGNAAAGRNITVVQKANSAGVTFTTANIIVTGTDQFGTAQTETIAIQTGAVAMDKFRWTIGTKVFATVTNVRLSAAQPTNAQISIGLGTIIGLRGKITAESDIKSLSVAGADVGSGTYVGSSTLHSIDPGSDLADDSDIIVTYDAVASSLLDRAAAASTDVGKCRVEAVGV